jgi:hypothetical protein
MTTLTLVLSCLSLVLSLVSLGYARTTARRWRSYTKPIEPKAICGCDHHASFHDDEGCHFIDTDRYGREAPECGCKKYMGPEPLPEAYLP